MHILNAQIRYIYTIYIHLVYYAIMNYKAIPVIIIDGEMIDCEQILNNHHGSHGKECTCTYSVFQMKNFFPEIRFLSRGVEVRTKFQISFVTRCQSAAVGSRYID